MKTAVTPPSTLKMIGWLLRYRTPLFLLTASLWLLNHASPVLYGVLDKGLFDALSAGPAGTANPWTFLVLLLIVNLARLVNLAAAFLTFSVYWLEVQLLLRRNLLRWLLTAKGARRLPDSPSEAVTRFRDDVEDIARYVDSYVDLAGFVSFALIAIIVMLGIDAYLTVLVLLPMLIAVLFARVLQVPIRNTRRRLREATGRVTDFIGEMMGSIQALRIAGHEESALARFSELNETRRRAGLRDSLLTESFRSVSDNMVSVATGIMLLAAADRMNRGAFTVGDFALFMAYLPYLTSIMTWFGNMLVEHRRAGVAFERLGRLLVDAPVAELVRSDSLGLTADPPELLQQQPRRVPLRHFRVDGLSYSYPDGNSGINDISFSLERGTLTVITGRVGSGKTTLLRTLLGLLPRAAGTISWNGEEVTDPASFLVPPQVAYTAQVPRLFSDTLRENLVLGRHAAAAGLERAIGLAVLERDVALLDEGLDTQVGSRGVRLSGGQVQRSAAARMFLRDAELLVFDDLSSALDVETESRLWQGIFAGGDATCLVVSHRRAALERADRILVMDNGQLVASGTMEELLAAGGAFSLLWTGSGAGGTPAGSVADV